MKFPKTEKELTKSRTQVGPNTYWILTAYEICNPLNTLHLTHINIYTQDDGQGYKITYKAMEEIYVAHNC